MLNLSDEWWFLGQAVHWVAWRDDQFHGLGALAVAGPEANAAVKCLANSRLTALGERWNNAERDLFIALAESKLCAKGNNSVSGEREDLPANIWDSATSDPWDNLASDRPCTRSIVTYPNESGGDLGGRVEFGHEKWFGVRVSRRAVLKLWPRRDDGGGCLSDGELMDWLNGWKQINGRRPHSRLWSEYAELKALGVTKERFEQFVREHFTAPKRGRPEKGA
jgi:hypothetical protein